MAILIFERSLEVTERLIELINEAQTGIKIYAASSFPAAVNIVQQHQLKVALLDLNFSGNFSLKLLRLIKKTDKAIVVIMQYTYADENIMEEYKLYEADHIFDKYNDFEKIPLIIKEVVQSCKY